GGARAGGGGGAGTAALPPTGRGFEATHDYIGFPTETGASGAAHSLGLTGLDFGDQVGHITAAVALANSRGGILGLTIVPVFHDIKTAKLLTDPETQAQATCTAFTEDRTVLAVVNLVAGTDRPTFYQCLKAHGTPVVTG